jgi:hypothetical protein
VPDANELYVTKKESSDVRKCVVKDEKRGENRAEKRENMHKCQKNVQNEAFIYLNICS